MFLKWNTKLLRTFKLSGILILIRIPPPTQQNNVSYT